MKTNYTIRQKFIIYLGLMAVAYFIVIKVCITNGVCKNESCQQPSNYVQESYLTEQTSLAPEKLSNVQFLSNYDADTILVNVANVPNIFGYHIPVRVSHIDSPEITSTDECARKVAQEGKLFANNLLKKAKVIDLVNVRRDKYFRLLAEVKLDDSIYLHKELLDAHLAVPYEGDTKPSINWCKLKK